MFERVIFADRYLIFAIVAFVVAAAIFSAMCWRALRMSRGQVEHFARLPFQDDARPPPSHD